MKTWWWLASGLTIVSPDVAAAATKVPVVVSHADRTVAGREVQITLPQTEIATSIELGRIASASGGGLLGSILISASDNRAKTMAAIQRERADATAAPLRAVLRGVEVDSLALATTRKALTPVDWLAASQVVATKDIPDRAHAALAISSIAPALAFIDYRYDLSPDFSQIRVIADVMLARCAHGAPDVTYRQRLESIVQLRVRSYEPTENVARWSADDGKLAKQALVIGFARLESLIPDALKLTVADAALLSAPTHEKGFGAGLYGPLVSRDSTDPESVRLWSDGFVQVTSVP